ncbi:hypothetical protein [Synechococcus sp. A15-28]|uniref:DUF7219 family protein n=1 Tax=Synechococcus sp. A15-28 TaxID=1050638 RepID=UPI00336AD22F
MAEQDGIRNPMEMFSSFHGKDWTPQRAAFHQNLEQFADRIGLIVGLQANGKISQEEAYEQIKSLWKTLKNSKNDLLSEQNSDA